jgi:DNA-binding GntR family transcriptional regulator
MKLSKLVKDKNLTWFSKMLFYEILDNSFEFGYFYYSTSFLAKTFEVSEKTILNSLKELEQNNYIRRETTLYDGKNQIKERKIYILGSEENFITWCKIFPKVLNNFSEGSEIKFSTLVKIISEGSENFYDRYCKELHINFTSLSNNIIIEKEELKEESEEKIKTKKVTKEKTTLHTFEKSKYFENYELFKSEFEEKYPNIDSKFYYEKYSNQAISKGYKNADWKRTFQNWLNDLKGNYQKIEVSKVEIKPAQKKVIKYLNYLTEEQMIKEVFNLPNARNVLINEYNIDSYMDFAQLLDALLPTNRINKREIWERYEPAN